MTSERHKVKVAVYLLLQDTQGRYLMVRRYNTGYQDGNYNLPSGHVEKNELPIDALIREANEEVGVSLLPEDVTFVHALYRINGAGVNDYIDLYFRADRYSGEVENVEPHKCDDIGWYAPDALPENTTPHVRHVIERVAQGVCFSEIVEVAQDDPGV